ncbi:MULTISPECIES: hypothetical protein [Tepidanaerobacter]|nr:MULTISPECIES: hypothetical protein [Tepidanaerobacter]
MDIKDLKTNLEITNLNEFKEHIEKMQRLIEEANKEAGIIKSFKFDVKVD